MFTHDLKTLVAFKTRTDDMRENRRALEWVAHAIRRAAPMHIRLHTHNGFSSLVATSQRTKSPKLWLVAHMDVVDAVPALFRLREHRGRYIGRGVADMKFAIALYLDLLRSLGTSAKEYDFGIMVTCDEEIGGANGVRALLDDNGYRGKLAVVPDSGANWEFRLSANGGFRIRVSARGKAGHGSRPWEGENAIDRLMSSLACLKKLFPKEPCGKKIHHHATCTIGTITGGTGVNVIPDFASADCDIRIPPSTSLETMRRRIRARCLTVRGIKVSELELLEPYHIDKHNPYLQTFLRHARAAGARPSFGNGTGTCDARFFTARGTPAIVFRPKSGGHHGDREWMNIADMNRFARVLRAFVTDVAQRG